MEKPWVVKKARIESGFWELERVRFWKALEAVSGEKPQLLMR